MQGRDVYSQLTHIAAQLLGRPGTSLDPTTPLDSLGLDSVERVELLTRIEDQFDVTIPRADAIHLTSLDVLARYLTVNAP